jgi:hypothetical protein
MLAVEVAFKTGKDGGTVNRRMTLGLLMILAVTFMITYLQHLAARQNLFQIRKFGCQNAVLITVLI